MADTPEWIDHDGGPCPVEPTTLVLCRFRGGEEDDEDLRTPARELYWDHDRAGSDIIAYRVVKP